MALANGIFGQTFKDCFDGSDQTLDLTNDAIICMLIEDNYTPDFSAATSALADIVVGNRTSGTGTFTSTFANKTLTVSGGYLTFDNTVDTTYTTITTSADHIQGCVIYDDTMDAAQTDPMICVVDFDANYPVNAGNFTIVWASTGIFRIGLT